MTDFDKAWSDVAEAATGGWVQASDVVKKKMSYHKGKGVNMWIGIASNVKEGCRARWNDKYKKLGLNYMAPLYKTDSDDFRKKMEEDLIMWCKENNYSLDNINAGGGGAEGTAPYFVYIAS